MTLRRGTLTTQTGAQHLNVRVSPNGLVRASLAPGTYDDALVSSHVSSVVAGYTWRYIRVGTIAGYVANELIHFDALPDTTPHDQRLDLSFFWSTIRNVDDMRHLRDILQTLVYALDSAINHATETDEAIT